MHKDHVNIHLKMRIKIWLEFRWLSAKKGGKPTEPRHAPEKDWRRVDENTLHFSISPSIIIPSSITFEHLFTIINPTSTEPSIHIRLFVSGNRLICNRKSKMKHPPTKNNCRNRFTINRFAIKVSKQDVGRFDETRSVCLQRRDCICDCWLWEKVDCSKSSTGSCSGFSRMSF